MARVRLLLCRRRGGVMDTIRGTGVVRDTMVGGMMAMKVEIEAAVAAGNIIVSIKEEVVALVAVILDHHIIVKVIVAGVGIIIISEDNLLSCAHYVFLLCNKR
jgi:hypothetical protein